MVYLSHRQRHAVAVVVVGHASVLYLQLLERQFERLFVAAFLLVVLLYYVPVPFVVLVHNQVYDRLVDDDFPDSVAVVAPQRCQRDDAVQVFDISQGVAFEVALAGYHDIVERDSQVREVPDKAERHVTELDVRVYVLASLAQYRVYYLVFE